MRMKICMLTRVMPAHNKKWGAGLYYSTVIFYCCLEKMLKAQKIVPDKGENF